MPHMTMLQITPASYDEPQRVEASAAATQLGEGLRMEIGNMMTRFYTDSEVQVGQVAIWMPLRYKAPLEYVTTLAHPTDRFDVADWLPKAEFVPSLPLPTTPTELDAEPMMMRGQYRHSWNASCPKGEAPDVCVFDPRPEFVQSLSAYENGEQR